MEAVILAGAKWQRERIHAGAEQLRVALWHGGDEIGHARQGKRAGEAADKDGDLASEPERSERALDQAVSLSAAGDFDMFVGFTEPDCRCG